MAHHSNHDVRSKPCGGGYRDNVPTEETNTKESIVAHLITLNFWHFAYLGLRVEIHRFLVDGRVQVSRHVYHPQNHAWLKCATYTQFKRTVRAIARNERILSQVRSLQ